MQMLKARPCQIEVQSLKIQAMPSNATFVSIMALADLCSPGHNYKGVI